MSTKTGDEKTLGDPAFSIACVWRGEVKQISSLFLVVAGKVILFPSKWHGAYQSRGGTWPLIQSVFQTSS